MRNGLIGLVTAMVLVSAMATAGCSGGGGAGGSSSAGGAGGTGGSSSSGGTTGSGSSSSGGTNGSGACICTGGAGGLGGSSSSGGSATGGSSGSGGTGAGGGSVTTLSGTKTIQALTTAEATQLCDDTYAYFGSAIPHATACKWAGVAFAASSSAPTQEVLTNNCTTHETSCPISNPGCSDLPSTCKATVAEYSACISDEVAVFIQAVSGLPDCDTITRAALEPVNAAMSADPPASCASLSDKCPDLYPPTPYNN